MIPKWFTRCTPSSHWWLCLQAHCILDIVSHAESHDSSLAANLHSALSSHTALSANVRVTPGVQTSSDLIDLAWQGVQKHSKSSQGMYAKP